MRKPWGIPEATVAIRTKCEYFIFLGRFQVEDDLDRICWYDISSKAWREPDDTRSLAKAMQTKGVPGQDPKTNVEAQLRLHRLTIEAELGRSQVRYVKRELGNVHPMHCCAR